MSGNKNEGWFTAAILVGVLACIPSGYFLGSWSIENITNPLIESAEPYFYDNIIGVVILINVLFFSWCIPLIFTIWPVFVISKLSENHDLDIEKLRRFEINKAMDNAYKSKAVAEEKVIDPPKEDIKKIELPQPSINEEKPKTFAVKAPSPQEISNQQKPKNLNHKKFNTLIEAPSNVRTLGGLELYYKFDEGHQISEGQLIMELKGSSSHVGLYASKNCIIRFIHEDEGSIIRLEGKHLCTMNTPIELVWKDIDKDDEISMETKSYENHLSSEDKSSRSETVEVQLEELKKLYRKKLISKSVYEQKQKEILKNI